MTLSEWGAGKLQLRDQSLKSLARGSVSENTRTYWIVRKSLLIRSMIQIYLQSVTFLGLNGTSLQCTGHRTTRWSATELNKRSLAYTVC